jgi:phosphomannomutase
MIKKKVICPSHQIADVLKMIRQLYADAPMDLTDGVKVTLPHGWLHVRASNTEPIIRLSAEAETEEQVEQIVESVFGLVQEAVAL